MLFKDRYEAATELIPYLEKYENKKEVVVAALHGGIPLGYSVSKKYNLPLKLLLTKNINHPSNPKTSIGTVGLNYHVLENQLNVSQTYIDNEIRCIRESFKKRFRSLDESGTPVENKTVIIIDDGSAAGNILSATLQIVRKQNPKKLIVAIPLAAMETVNKIVKEVDGLICLYIVKEFTDIKQHYYDLKEVSDKKVLQLLKDINSIGNAGPAIC